MSDLQIVLIVLGVFIIAGVVIYNWLQEKKLRENITEEFIVPQKDVLVEEFYVDTDALVDKELEDVANKADIIGKINGNDDRKEPGISEALVSDASADDKTIQVKETEAEDASSGDAGNKEGVADGASSEPPVVADASEVIAPDISQEAPETNTDTPELEVNKEMLPPEFEPIATSSLPDAVHSQIDLTAFLYATKNIDGQALHAMMKTTLRDIGVSILLHGLDSEDVWQVIDDASVEGVAYKQVACSLQLADRRGAVPKPVLNKFQFAIETAGVEFGAHVEWQGKGDATQRAVDLDKFCLDVDQLVSVHLIQGEAPIHGTKFKGLAEANGMKLKQSRFCYAEDASAETPQFVIVNADDQPFTSDGLRNDIVRGATFQIEIPKVENCEHTFNEMVLIAQKMANSLGARMVDDNQKPLGDLQIEKIRQQLKVIHATMIARGVIPGSANSMRLFN